jgi:NTE family protein
MLNSAFVDTLEGDLEHLERINRLVALIPEEQRRAHGIALKQVENLTIWPSEAVDKIAGRKIRFLPASIRTLLRRTGATASGGGAAAASYLLFAQPFIEDLINLGYRDAMWEADRMKRFFAPADGSQPELAAAD